MNILLTMIAMCGYLLVLCMGIVIGFLLGRNPRTYDTLIHSNPDVPPGLVFGYKSDNLKVPDSDRTATPPVQKKRPTQSSIMRFKKPDVARREREQRIVDEELTRQSEEKNNKPKGPIVL